MFWVNVFISFGYIPRGRIIGSYGSSFVNKGLSSQGYGFSSGHVWMWELDYKENWVSKNWCFWTVVLEKTLESLVDCKEIQPVHPKGDQSWVFIGRTDVEAETPWNSPGKNIGVHCHSLLQGSFQTQGLKPSLWHCTQILYCLSHKGSP